MKKKKVQKIELKNQAFFYFGIIIGLAGGFMGNIFVSSANNLVISSCKNTLCYKSSFALMIASFIIFIALIIWILWLFDKIIKKLIKKK